MSAGSLLKIWPGLFVLVLLRAMAAAPAGRPSGPESAHADWPTYLGDKARSLYSPLRQINRENVAGLKEAWSYDTGDAAAYQANNLVIDGILFTVSPTQKVIALNAANGRELWVWAPKPEESTGGAGPTHGRGLVHWQNDRGGEKRIFSAFGTRSYALDPKSGRVIPDFGENGSIHLGKGLDDMGAPNVLYTAQDRKNEGKHGNPACVDSAIHQRFPNRMEFLLPTGKPERTSAFI